MSETINKLEILWKECGLVPNDIQKDLYKIYLP